MALDAQQESALPPAAANPVPAPVPEAEPEIPVPAVLDPNKLSLSERFADAVTSTLGSWKFIIAQSTVLAAWITLNSIDGIKHWDPYPFILLNLALSFQAAYTGPFVMISQNRQSHKDRQTAESDYAVDLECAREIKELHRKIDFLLAALPEAQKQAFLAGAEPKLAPAVPAIAKPQPAPGA